MSNIKHIYVVMPFLTKRIQCMYCEKIYLKEWEREKEGEMTEKEKYI